MASAKRIGILVLILGVLAATAGTTACQKKVEKAAAPAQVQAPTTQFEGPVKTALGKYLYMPAARGFDIVAQGFDASTLIGKNVRVKGEMLTDKPSIFRADSIEVKDSSGAYATAYTRTQNLAMEDFVDVKARESYPPLAITGPNKPEEWEGKGNVRVYGKLLDTKVKTGATEAPITYIVISDDAGKEVGKIIVDKTSEFAKYYLEKLRLFDQFWFYINVKDSVDKKIRPRTKELFHADVVFAGLF